MKPWRVSPLRTGILSYHLPSSQALCRRRRRRKQTRLIYLLFTVTDGGATCKAMVACINPPRIHTCWTRRRSVDEMLDGGNGHRHQLVAKSAECVANVRLPDGLFTNEVSDHISQRPWAARPTRKRATMERRGSGDRHGQHRASSRKRRCARRPSFPSRMVTEGPDAENLVTSEL